MLEGTNKVQIKYKQGTNKVQIQLNFDNKPKETQKIRPI